MDDLTSNNRFRISEQRQAIASTLLKAITPMHHIDEVLHWVAEVVVQRFHTQVAAIWTLQTVPTEPVPVQLRALVRQDPSIPDNILTNSSILLHIRQLLNEQRGHPFQPVSELFSTFQTTLLRRYGLNYSAALFQKSNTLLPPPGQGLRGAVPVPGMFILFIFSRQELSQDALPLLSIALEQSIVIAEGRGLLLPPSAASTRSPTMSPLTQDIFLSLVPHRHREAELLMSRNPLSRSVDIADKNARHLYAAIDGRRNVGALCNATRMHIKDFARAARLLLSQRRIEFYGPAGQPVDASPFLEER